MAYFESAKVQKKWYGYLSISRVILSPRISRICTYFILHSLFFILHSSFFILHSSFFILHSSLSNRIVPASLFAAGVFDKSFLLEFKEATIHGGLRIGGVGNEFRGAATGMLFDVVE